MTDEALVTDEVLDSDSIILNEVQRILLVRSIQKMRNDDRLIESSKRKHSAISEFID